MVVHRLVLTEEVHLPVPHQPGLSITSRESIWKNIFSFFTLALVNGQVKHSKGDKSQGSLLHTALRPLPSSFGHSLAMLPSSRLMEKSLWPLAARRYAELSSAGLHVARHWYG